MSKKMILLVLVSVLSFSVSAIPIIPIIFLAGSAAVPSLGAFVSKELVDNNVLLSDSFNFFGSLSESHMPELKSVIRVSGSEKSGNLSTLEVGKEYELILSLRFINKHWYNSSKDIEFTVSIPDADVLSYVIIEKDKESEYVIVDGLGNNFSFSLKSGKENEVEPAAFVFRFIPRNAGEKVLKILFDQNVKKSYTAEMPVKYVSR